MKIPEVNLIRSGTPVTIDQEGSRAFSLTDNNLPHSDGTKVSIHRIIEFLKVKTAIRYKATASQTFCNIYAHDFARLMRAYVPRVWWTDAIIAKGFFGVPKYGENVREMNVNSLYIWFDKYGESFGWKQSNITRGQAAANAGKCVIMLAANKVSSKSGHIVAIVPETYTYKAVGSRGIIVVPVQSQAGRVNKAYFVENWWKSGHQPVKIFVYEP